jgi:hypothetical protein
MGTFVAWANGYVETATLSALRYIQWPKYAGDYERDDDISTRTINEGLFEVLDQPREQFRLLFLYFKMLKVKILITPLAKRKKHIRLIWEYYLLEIIVTMHQQQ